MGPKCTPEIVNSNMGEEKPVVVPPSPLLLVPVGKQPAHAAPAIQMSAALVRTNVAPSAVSRAEDPRFMDRSLTPSWRSFLRAATMDDVDRVGGVLVETYRLERLIAEGSMGSVYEARHLRIPKRFAVKFMRIGLTENKEALERFRREAEVVAGLDHPNIVEIYDYNTTEDGSPYIE